MAINNAETWARTLMLNTTCDSEQTRPGTVWGEEEKPANISPRQPGNYSWDLFISSYFFVPSFYFSGAGLHLDTEAVSDEVAGIENQIWRECSCNWLIIENFPNWHELRDHASVGGARVQGMSSSAWRCSSLESVGGLETERGGSSGHVSRVIWWSYITNIRGRRWDVGDKWHSQTSGRGGERPGHYGDKCDIDWPSECHGAGLFVVRQINSENVHVFNSCIQVKLVKEEIKKPSRREAGNHLVLLCVS